MGKLKMNCGYCGRKCSLEKDFCIPQDSVYVCKSCYEWQNKISNLEAKLEEREKAVISILENAQLKQQLEEWEDGTIIVKWTDAENKVKELEEQLAEKDEEIKQLKFQIAVDEDWAITNRTRLTELEDELAEKEKEIEKLKIILSMQAVQVPEEQRLNLITDNCVQYNPNQTAIAELEKLKNYLPNMALDIPDMVSYRYLKKQIDQQIKSLKGDADV